MKTSFKSKLPIALWRPPHTDTLTSYSSLYRSSDLDTKLNRESLTSKANKILASIAEEDPETVSTPELCARKSDNNLKSSSSTCLHKSSLPITSKLKFASRSTGNLAQTQIKSGSDAIKKPTKPPVIKTPFILPHPIKKKAVVSGNSPAFKMPYLASKSLGSLTKDSIKKASPQTTKPLIARNKSLQVPVIVKKNVAVQTPIVDSSPISRALVTGQRCVAPQRAALVVDQRDKEPDDAESPPFDFTALLLECGTIPNDDSITIELAELYAQLQVNLKEHSIIIQQLHDCYLKDIERKTVILEITPRPDKKLLVLDLDHTLCDIDDEYYPVQENAARPFLLEFLKAVNQYYEIVIWSEKTLPSIQLILRALGLNDIPNFNIMLLLDYDDMITVAIPHVGLRKIKPLSIIWNKLEQFSKINTIILDDLPMNFYLNANNGLQVKPYNKEDFTTDDELKKIEVYLNAIAKFCPDFSSLSHKHYGQYRNI